MKNIRFLALSILLATAAATANACDVCAIYTATEAEGVSKRGPFLGVAEQFTHFGTLQRDGREVPDSSGQYLDSSITQAVLGYAFNQRFSLQVNVPLIYRHYRRPEGFRTETGTVNGLGDVSLLANFLALRKDTNDVTLTWKLSGGVKAPTGDPRRLHEEMHEMHDMDHEGAPESGIHGHDLTLGSGSWDGIVGTDIYLRYKRAFFTGGVQYAIRSRGYMGYRFANDLTWDFGPGAYLLLEHSYTAALQGVIAGEHKGLDTSHGEKAEDTGITAWYAGPRLIATYQDRLSGEVSVEIPFVMDNTSLQTVPDYRVRAAVTWRF